MRKPAPVPPATAAGCVAILVVSLGLAGCASQAQRVAAQPVADPVEPLNRKVFAFNDALDRALLRPAAVGWKKGLPPQFRTGFGNALDNAQMPITIINDFLQGKLAQGGQDTARFVINTIVGLGGLFDPATDAGLLPNQEDFGQTLNTWGVAQGPFLMVPLIGPRTLTHGIGNVADLPASAYLNLRSDGVAWGLFGLNIVNSRAGLLDIDEEFRKAYDPYAFLRDAYLQNRAYRIADGQLLPPEPEDFEDYGDDEEPAP